MFRMLVLLIVVPLLAVFASFRPAHAENGITAPAAGVAVSGTIPIEAVAVHPTFRKWQLDLLLDGDDRHTHFLAVGEQPAPESTELAQLDTTLFPDGHHLLRLRVVYFGLNYDEFTIPITINNGGAQSPKAASDTPVKFRDDAPADGKRWIEVDISDQHLTVWQGDVPIFETTVSTGKPGYRTLPGTFRVYRKYELTRMTGPDYDTPDVPWTMYYSGDFAIHGAYWHDNFGTPVSHGCVNLRVPEARAIFEWADVGTEVVVHQ
jgi:hypothetical protein